MKTQKSGIMGVIAAPPRPDWRGFLAIALLLSVPFVVLVLLSG